MNIKRSICTALVLFITFPGFSQSEIDRSRYGLEVLAGCTFSAYSGKDISNNGPLFRYTGGLRASYDVFPFLSFETGAGYGKFGTVERPANEKIRNVVSYFQFPLIIRYQWGDFSIGAGMELNLLNTAKVIVKEENQLFDGLYHEVSKINTKDQYHRFRSGYCLDFVYKPDDIHSFGFSGSYIPKTILKNGYDWKLGYLTVYYKLNLLEL